KGTSERCQPAARFPESARRRALPAVAENCLPAGECRECCGVGTKHTRPQADGGNKRQFGKSVKLGTRKATLRSAHDRIGRVRWHVAQSLCDRRCLAGLGTKDQPARG